MGVTTVRKSVVLSCELVETLSTLAPASIGTNFNRLVTVALEEYAARQEQQRFAEAMKLMAEDEQIQNECSAISQEFRSADADGLADD